MLDLEEKHYIEIKNDLNKCLYSMHDKMDDVRVMLNDTCARKETIESEKLTNDNIYKILMQFDKLFYIMNDVEKRKLVELLIDEIQIYEERQTNGQWIKNMNISYQL